MYVCYMFVIVYGIIIIIIAIWELLLLFIILFL